VLSTAGIVLAMIAGALAVDIGFLAEEARRNQKVADLAALDAIRVLPADPTSAARTSACNLKTDLVRPGNGFPCTEPGYSLVVEWAATKAGPWSQAAGALSSATAVRVTAISPHTNKFPFVPGGQTTTRRGIAATEDRAQFSIGSNLATLDTSDTNNLNRVLNAMFGSATSVNMNVVGYQGLSTASVSLSDLITATPSLGTPDELLAAPLTAKRLAQLMVVALNNKGDAASLTAATLLGNFAGNITTATTFKLSDILSIEQPANPGSVAAATQFNVLDLLTGAGQAAVSNGTGFVDVPGLTVSVAGLGATTLRLTIIEPPQISAFGPARYDTATGTWATRAQTAQVKVDLTTRITVGSCGGLLATCVDWQLPLKVSAAQAEGSLTDVRCPAASRQADIMVATQGANATANNTLTVKLLGLNLVPPLSVVSTNVAIAGTTAPHNTLLFSGPPFPTPIQSTAANGAGLTTATQSQLTLLGILPVGPVLDLVSPVTAAVDEEILEPIFDALGFSLAGADVRTLRVECGVPGLVG
jgi:uncharacterized membrane protein